MNFTEQVNAADMNADAMHLHLTESQEDRSNSTSEQFVPVPEDLLARLRKENSELEQFKQLINLQVQVKELQFKNTILETYVKMGLKPTDSFNINTGLAEIK